MNLEEMIVLQAIAIKLRAPNSIWDSDSPVLALLYWVDKKLDDCVCVEEPEND